MKSGNGATISKQRKYKHKIKLELIKFDQIISLNLDKLTCNEDDVIIQESRLNPKRISICGAGLGFRFYG